MLSGPLPVKQTGVTSSIDSSSTQWQWQLERVDFIVSPCCRACLRLRARACGVGWHLSSVHKLIRSIAWIAMRCSCLGGEEEPVEALCSLAHLPASLNLACALAPSIFLHYACTARSVHFLVQLTALLLLL
jgi:hypothetical protein